jgi:hypothetical protein
MIADDARSWRETRANRKDSVGDRIKYCVQCRLNGLLIKRPVETVCHGQCIEPREGMLYKVIRSTDFT